MDEQAPPHRSTLKRPADKLLQRFDVRDIGNDTVGEYISKSFCLVICCKDCPRMIEWTPLDLHDRFGDKPKLKIADIAVRLSCSGEDGCGSRSVAVLPRHWIA